jgi:hypothetical protein
MKSILTDDQGRGEIQKHQKTNTNNIYLRILDIRKNEHFGALLMFLNKRSPLSLRVKTKKAELFFLKKIDAVEISTSYPNIWKRVNKKSFHNLKQIKTIMKKIIKHFCETYGINFDFSSKIYNLNKKDLEKINQNLQKLNIFPNQLSNQLLNPRRASVDVRNAQLKMFQHFPKQTQIVATKTNVEKQIEKLVPKKFELNGGINNNFTIKDIKSNNDNNNNNSINDSNSNSNNEKKSSLSSSDNPIDCSVSMIKVSKKDTMLGYGHPVYIRDNNNNMENSYRSNNNNKSIFANENNISKKSIKNTNQNNENMLNSNKRLIQYGEEETNNLMKFFGTPYYPEDINDEVYPGEIFGIGSPRANNNNVFEQEYTSVNNLLLSYDTNKNNVPKMKTKSIVPAAYDINNRSNNFTINNNYITNNVINNINPKNTANNFSIFHFDVCIKKDNINEKKKFKLKTDNRLRLDFSIFKNSFEIFSTSNLNLNNHFKKKTNVNNVNNLNKNLKIETVSPKHRRNNSCVNITKKIKVEKKNDDDDKYSSAYSDVSSYNSNTDSDNFPNLFTNDGINSQKSIIKDDEKNSEHNNTDNDEKIKIIKCVVFKIKAKYENLNSITDGEYSNSKNLQKCVKSILIKKVLKHKDDNNFNLKTETLEKLNYYTPKNYRRRKTFQRKSIIIKQTMQKKKTIQANLTLQKKSTIQKKPITKKCQSIQAISNNPTIKSPKSPNRIKATKNPSTYKLQKNKTLSKNFPEKLFSNNLIKDSAKKEKLRKTELKSLFNKHMISEIEEKKEKNTTIKKKNDSRIKGPSDVVSSHSIPKRRKTKKNEDDFFLDYVNRNIRDDNAVLNNPGQFYNGFFHDIIQRVNEEKMKKSEN